MSNNGTVVVGVDGSEGSLAALKVAAEEARRRSALLRVVTAYELPSYWALPAGPAIGVTPEEIAQNAHEQTQAEVDQLLAGDPTAPKVDVFVTAGPAAKVLVDAAEDADLLVVGHRGRGGFSSMLLGSVGLACVLHAPCTVTVVREATRER
ncbi:universal stress protein [Pseudonocardia acaciae]|uniref:universal stress protein n=1 Tax=Pseudonocardia acaciae TaxID=551276 RepID=UPI00048EC744|nr:universal stress protein [Pseudonocardia acaciae]